MNLCSEQGNHYRRMRWYFDNKISFRAGESNNHKALCFLCSTGFLECLRPRECMTLIVSLHVLPLPWPRRGLVGDEDASWSVCWILMYSARPFIQSSALKFIVSSMSDILSSSLMIPSVISKKGIACRVLLDWKQWIVWASYNSMGGWEGPFNKPFDNYFLRFTSGSRIALRR